MVFRRRLFVAILFSLVLAPVFALPPAVHHPLDALTPEEYWKIYTVLRDAGKLEEKTIFASVLLREPLKSDVLAWKAGDPILRKGDAVLLTEGKSYAAVIDISAGKLDSYVELKGYQAPVSEGELHGFDDLLKKDPRIVDALKKRDITDLRLVTCYVTPAGYVGLPEQTEGRRIGWGGCTYSATARRRPTGRRPGARPTSSTSS